MKFDFFRGNECEQYLFYRVPQVLFTDDEFRYISSEAKLLYGFLLDRTALSAKNKWTDEDGKVYVYFTQDEAKEKLNIENSKATVIDVMQDFADIYGEWSDKYGCNKWQKLTKCATYYGYDWENDTAHDSLADCRATLYCYNKINECKEDLRV